MQDEEHRRSLNRRFKKLEEERTAKRHVEKSPHRRRCVKTPSPSLCRALFGRSAKSDRDESIDYARVHLRQLADEQRQRWNFNFDTETPLAGRWQWEKVEQPNPAATRDASMTVPKPTLPLRPRQSNANPPTRNSGQLRITDFLKQRRAASTTFDSSKTDQLKMDVAEPYDSALAENNSKTEA